MVFQQFLTQVEQFLKLKNLPRQAVLILDNASTHPDAQYIQDKEIKAIHLPPNVTSLIQPMGQGVLAALKKRYRRKLLSSLMLAVEEGDDLVAKKYRFTRCHRLGQSVLERIRANNSRSLMEETFRSFGQ